MRIYNVRLIGEKLQEGRRKMRRRRERVTIDSTNIFSLIICSRRVNSMFLTFL